MDEVAPGTSTGSYKNIDALPMGKILQPKQDRGITKQTATSRLRSKGHPKRKKRKSEK